ACTACTACGHRAAYGNQGSAQEVTSVAGTPRIPAEFCTASMERPACQFVVVPYRPLGISSLHQLVIDTYKPVLLFVS
ncbi:MAG: hypothetical protein WCR05_07305, partial [Sphaerochaetaceae bacterium]